MENQEPKPNQELWFSGTDWTKLLQMTRLYDFDPSPLVTSEAVSAHELAGLATAVEEALDDIPNHNARGSKTSATLTPFEWFSGERKEKLRRLVYFCRESQILGDN